MFDLVEARQAGVRFSRSLPTAPALLVTNAIAPYDDTRYAFNERYRRELHLLNTGTDLTAKGDRFDLALAPELPAKGVKVEVVDVRDVGRPGGTVHVFQVRVSREKAPFVDLAFSGADPYYKNPDLWIDWAGDNPSPDPSAHRRYPEDEPTDQGEIIHVPVSGGELHWMVARLRNLGTFKALDVKLD